MKFTANIPNCAWGYRISAVYKIAFNTGHFYVGCSENLKSRSSAWKALFEGGNSHDIGKAMVDVVSRCEWAILDIIEMCSASELKDRESFYLNKYKNDLMMVSKEHCSWKPVLQYTIDGKFVKKHVSIGSAARFIGCKVGRVQEVVNNQRHSYIGMRFFFEADHHRPKRLHPKRELKNKRNIVMSDESGSIIQTFKKLTEASKEVGLTPETIAYAISGKRKTSKGVMFAYQ